MALPAAPSLTDVTHVISQFGNKLELTYDAPVKLYADEDSEDNKVTGLSAIRQITINDTLNGLNGEPVVGADGQVRTDVQLTVEIALDNPNQLIISGEITGSRINSISLPANIAQGASERTSGTKAHSRLIDKTSPSSDEARFYHPGFPRQIDALACLDAVEGGENEAVITFNNLNAARALIENFISNRRFLSLFNGDEAVIEIDAGINNTLALSRDGLRVTVTTSGTFAANDSGIPVLEVQSNGGTISTIPDYLPQPDESINYDFGVEVRSTLAIEPVAMTKVTSIKFGIATAPSATSPDDGNFTSDNDVMWGDNTDANELNNRNFLFRAIDEQDEDDKTDDTRFFWAQAEGTELNNEIVNRRVEIDNIPVLNGGQIIFGSFDLGNLLRRRFETVSTGPSNGEARAQGGQVTMLFDNENLSPQEGTTYTISQEGSDQTFSFFAEDVTVVTRKQTVSGRTVEVSEWSIIAPTIQKSDGSLVPFDDDQFNNNVNEILMEGNLTRHTVISGGFPIVYRPAGFTSPVTFQYDGLVASIGQTRVTSTTENITQTVVFNLDDDIRNSIRDNTYRGRQSTIYKSGWNANLGQPTEVRVIKRGEMTTANAPEEDGTVECIINSLLERSQRPPDGIALQALHDERLEAGLFGNGQLGTRDNTEEVDTFLKRAGTSFEGVRFGDFQAVDAIFEKQVVGKVPSALGFKKKKIYQDVQVEAALSSRTGNAVTGEGVEFQPARVYGTSLVEDSIIAAWNPAPNAAINTYGRRGLGRYWRGQREGRELRGIDDDTRFLTTIHLVHTGSTDVVRVDFDGLNVIEKDSDNRNVEAQTFTNNDTDVSFTFNRPPVNDHLGNTNSKDYLRTIVDRDGYLSAVVEVTWGSTGFPGILGGQPAQQARNNWVKTSGGEWTATDRGIGYVLVGITAEITRGGRIQNIPKPTFTVTNKQTRAYSDFIPRVRALPGGDLGSDFSYEGQTLPNALLTGQYNFSTTGKSTAATAAGLVANVGAGIDADTVNNLLQPDRQRFQFDEDILPDADINGVPTSVTEALAGISQNNIVDLQAIAARAAAGTFTEEDLQVIANNGLAPAQVQAADGRLDPANADFIRQANAYMVENFVIPQAQAATIPPALGGVLGLAAGATVSNIDADTVSMALEVVEEGNVESLVSSLSNVGATTEEVAQLRNFVESRVGLPLSPSARPWSLAGNTITLSLDDTDRQTVIDLFSNRTDDDDPDEDVGLEGLYSSVMLPSSSPIVLYVQQGETTSNSAYFYISQIVRTGNVFKFMVGLASGNEALSSRGFFDSRIAPNSTTFRFFESTQVPPGSAFANPETSPNRGFNKDNIRFAPVMTDYLSDPITGPGIPEEFIDVSSFYRADQEAQRVPTECNGVLQDRESYHQYLEDMSISSGIRPYEEDGIIKARFRRPISEDDLKVNFTYENTAAIKLNSPRSDARLNEALIKINNYIDEDDKAPKNTTQSFSASDSTYLEEDNFIKNMGSFDCAFLSTFYIQDTTGKIRQDDKTNQTKNNMYEEYASFLMDVSRFFEEVEVDTDYDTAKSMKIGDAFSVESELYGWTGSNILIFEVVEIQDNHDGNMTIIGQRHSNAIFNLADDFPTLYTRSQEPIRANYSALPSNIILGNVTDLNVVNIKEQADVPEFTLEWTVPASGNILGFDIYRSTDDQADEGDTIIQQLEESTAYAAGRTMRYTVTGAPPTVHYYYVISRNGETRSQYPPENNRMPTDTKVIDVDWVDSGPLGSVNYYSRNNLNIVDAAGQDTINISSSAVTVTANNANLTFSEDNRAQTLNLRSNISNLFTAHQSLVYNRDSGIFRFTETDAGFDGDADTGLRAAVRAAIRNPDPSQNFVESYTRLPLLETDVELSDRGTPTVTLTSQTRCTRRRPSILGGGCTRYETRFTGTAVANSATALFTVTPRYTRQSDGTILGTVTVEGAEKGSNLTITLPRSLRNPITGVPENPISLAGDAELPDAPAAIPVPGFSLAGIQAAIGDINDAFNEFRTDIQASLQNSLNSVQDNINAFLPDVSELETQERVFEEDFSNIPFILDADNSSATVTGTPITVSVTWPAEDTVGFSSTSSSSARSSAIFAADDDIPSVNDLFLGNFATGISATYVNPLTGVRENWDPDDYITQLTSGATANSVDATDIVRVSGSLPITPSTVPPSAEWIPPEAYDPNETYNYTLQGYRNGGRNSQARIDVNSGSSAQYWDVDFEGEINDEGGTSDEQLNIEFRENFDSGGTSRTINTSSSARAYGNVEGTGVNVRVGRDPDNSNINGYFVEGIEDSDDLVFHVPGATGGTHDAAGNVLINGPAVVADNANALSLEGTTVASPWSLTGTVNVTGTNDQDARFQDLNTVQRAWPSLNGIPGLDLVATTGVIPKENQLLPRGSVIYRGLLISGEQPSRRSSLFGLIGGGKLDNTFGVVINGIPQDTNWRWRTRAYASYRPFYRTRRTRTWYGKTKTRSYRAGIRVIISVYHSIIDPDGRYIWYDRRYVRKEVGNPWLVTRPEYFLRTDPDARAASEFLVMSRAQSSQESRRVTSLGPTTTWTLNNSSGIDIEGASLDIDGVENISGTLKGNGSTFVRTTNDDNRNRAWSFIPGRPARFSYAIGDFRAEGIPFPADADARTAAEAVRNHINRSRGEFNRRVLPTLTQEFIDNNNVGGVLSITTTDFILPRVDSEAKAMNRFNTARFSTTAVQSALAAFGVVVNIADYNDRVFTVDGRRLMGDLTVRRVDTDPATLVNPTDYSTYHVANSTIVVFNSATPTDAVYQIFSSSANDRVNLYVRSTDDNGRETLLQLDPSEFTTATNADDTETTIMIPTDAIAGGLYTPEAGDIIEVGLTSSLLSASVYQLPNSNSWHVGITLETGSDEDVSFTIDERGSDGANVMGQFNVTNSDGGVDTRPKVDIIYTERNEAGAEIRTHCLTLLLRNGSVEDQVRHIVQSWDNSLLLDTINVNDGSRAMFHTSSDNPSLNARGDLRFIFTNTSADPAYTGTNTFRVGGQNTADTADSLPAIGNNLTFVGAQAKDTLSVMTETGFEGLVSFEVSSVSASSNAQIQFGEQHNFVVGDVITVSGITGETNLNGCYTITTVDSNERVTTSRDTSAFTGTATYTSAVANKSEFILRDRPINFNRTAAEIRAIIRDAYANHTLFYNPVLVDGDTVTVKSTIARESIIAPRTSDFVYTPGAALTGVGTRTESAAGNTVTVTEGTRQTGENFLFDTTRAQTALGQTPLTDADRRTARASVASVLEQITPVSRDGGLGSIVRDQLGL